MKNGTMQVYQDFRKAMLSGTDSWTNFIAENVHLKGPLAETTTKTDFIAVNTLFFASIQKSDIIEILELGNRIITRITTEVKMPNGTTTTLEVSEWYEIVEGKILSLIVYFDTHRFLAV